VLKKCLSIGLISHSLRERPGETITSFGSLYGKGKKRSPWILSPSGDESTLREREDQEHLLSICETPPEGGGVRLRF